MDDEELYKVFEPTQHTILGYVSDMWKSRNDLDEDLNANIIPLSVRNNDRWMPSSSTLVKRISKFFGDSIFAYKLTKSLPGLTKSSLLEFHVREASPNKGSKYSVDYDYEVKSVSLPYVLVTDYSSFSDQIESSFFNYHIVFIPKYRRKVLYGDNRQKLLGIIKRLCRDMDVEIVEGAMCPDHIHIRMRIPPRLSERAEAVRRESWTAAPDREGPDAVGERILCKHGRDQRGSDTEVYQGTGGSGSVRRRRLIKRPL